MNMSNYLEVELIKHIFRTGSYTKPSALYIGLGTAGADTGLTELSGTGSYARVQRDPSDSNWAAVSGGTTGTTSNSAIITFPTATADWNSGSAIGYVGIFDASSSGNLLFWAALTTPKIVLSGDSLSFAADALTVQIDN